jgi:hypothetical protein
MPHDKKRSLLKYSRLPLPIVILARSNSISRQIIFSPDSPDALPNPALADSDFAIIDM